MDLQRYNTKKSPFLDTSTPFTLWERVKFALLVATVVPRVLIALVLLLLFAFLSFIATYNWPEDKPLSGWRSKIIRFCRNISLLCAYLMGFIIRIEGWENYEEAIKKNIRIALFNHISYVDAFVLVGMMGCSGLSKESNKKLPILGSCIKGLQNIYLPDARQIIKDPSNAEKTVSREDSVTALIAKRASDPRYPILALAPEGTCGNGYCLLKFRTGAFVAGEPVLPVLLKYRTDCINPAWTNMNEGVHFLRLLCQFYNVVTIAFLEPYFPSDAEKTDPALYAENVRKLMAKALNVSMVDESYNHMYALTKLGITVSWDGETILDPKHVIDSEGFVDLTPILENKRH